MCRKFTSSVCRVDLWSDILLACIRPSVTKAATDPVVGGAAPLSKHPDGYQGVLQQLENSAVVHFDLLADSHAVMTSACFGSHGDGTV